MALEGESASADGQTKQLCLQMARNDRSAETFEMRELALLCG